MTIEEMRRAAELIVNELAGNGAYKCQVHGTQAKTCVKVETNRPILQPETMVRIEPNGPFHFNHEGFCTVCSAYWHACQLFGDLHNLLLESKRSR